MVARASALEFALRRHNRVVLVGLIAVVALSWAYLLTGAGMDMSMDMESMSMPIRWTLAYSLLMLLMWWIMMIAMMLPSAVPMILLFAALSRKNEDRGRVSVPTGFFVAGYVVAWGGFSLVATFLQWGLNELALLTPMMVSASKTFGAALLIAGGIYQLTPLKHACLRHCRGPLRFFGERWRAGAVGAWRMGLEHGLYCLGCCWVLMGLLFYGGVMNLMWIVGLTVYVLLEKVAPAGPWLARIAGVALIAWGLSILLA